jgi:serine/threonine protein kinase
VSYPSALELRKAVENKMYPGGQDFESVYHNGDMVLSAGGNALVFKVKNASGECFALKLFTDEVQGRFKRLSKISDLLAKARLPFTVNYKYEEQLIYVLEDRLAENERYFPGIIMPWLDGNTLDVHLKELIDSGRTDRIKELAESFREIALMLLGRGIAHGDIKLSNIMIDNGGKLFLIDYDGMYFPELDGDWAIEKGTPSYQHPLRSNDHFEARMDDFSILALYASLRALAVRPDLYSRYSDKDNLLFRPEDYIDIDKSTLFRELSSLSETADLAFFIRSSLMSDSISIMRLEALLKGNFPEPIIKVFQIPNLVSEGEHAQIVWEADHVSYVRVNGRDAESRGSLELVAADGLKVEFIFGYGTRRRIYQYQLNCEPKPVIEYFRAEKSSVRQFEPVKLRWKVKKARKTILRLGSSTIDVTGSTSYSLSGLGESLKITLEAYSMITDNVVKKDLDISVYLPIELIVVPDKHLTFPGRPVTISLKVLNADNVVMNPGAKSLTGKDTFEVLPEEDICYQIVASNPEYVVESCFIIEVLKLPRFEADIMKIPVPELIITSPSRQVVGRSQGIIKSNLFRWIKKTLNDFPKIPKFGFRGVPAKSNLKFHNEGK